MAGNTNF